jgi:fission process protein 1
LYFISLDILLTPRKTQLGLAVVPLLPTLFDEPVEHAVEWSFKRLCRAIGGEEAVTPPPRPSKSPAEKSTPLGSLMKLQSRKKRHEEEQQHLHGETPSRKEYNAEKQHGNEGGSWFGWRKKNKDE